MLAAAADPAGIAWRTFREAMARIDADLRDGRVELRRALQQFRSCGDANGELVAGAALVQCISIADDDYDGFEDAVASIRASVRRAEPIDDPADRLTVAAGALVAGWFTALDDPQLPAAAENLVRALADPAVPLPARARAGLSALGFYVTRARLEDLLWAELAMRPVVAEASLPQRLADEWHHALVQGLYECGAADRAQAVRDARRAAPGPVLLPAIELKLLLLEAQIQIGEERPEAGRAALALAEPMLAASAPRQAGWWHLLRSRLHLVDGRHADALVHARVALRLARTCSLPERWMGVTVMQEGQVCMASGAPREAVPFFEQAARAASGPQADFCWCLAHFAQALDDFDSGHSETACDHLRRGFALARQLRWLKFLRASPKVAASLCGHALEHGIEAAFVRDVIAARGLEAVRSDLSAWPWPIRVTTLGRFAIELHGQPLAFRGKVAKKPLELLQFLIASSGSDVSIDTATFALWRELDGDNAKAALNTALHRLRKLLGNDEAVLLELGRLHLNPRVLWVDCLAFERLADSLQESSRAAMSPAVSASRRALGLYGGAFLHDTEDHAWQMACRTRVASKYKRLVTVLVRSAVADGDTSGARALLERALEHDPLAEEMARELMRLLIDAGERATALAVFERCRDAIGQSLGVAPSSATLSLLARARVGEPPRVG